VVFTVFVAVFIQECNSTHIAVVNTSLCLRLICMVAIAINGAINGVINGASWINLAT
jgi:hypothetical protein